MNRSESKYFNTARRMDEALVSLLSEKELAYITVKEICGRAGVNRSTFYLHYETIADLLEETVAMTQERLQSNIPAVDEATAAAIENAPLQELFFITDRWLLPYLESVQANKHIYKAIHAQMGAFGAERTYRQFFQSLFSPILSRYGVAEDRHEYIMTFYRYGLVAVLMKWVDTDCRESPAQIAGIIKLCVGEHSL